MLEKRTPEVHFGLQGFFLACRKAGFARVRIFTDWLGRPYTRAGDAYAAGYPPGYPQKMWISRYFPVISIKC